MHPTKNLVTKSAQIVGGQRYIEVIGLNSMLEISTFEALGQQTKFKLTGSWFGRCRKSSDQGSYVTEYSLGDLNIPPNHYNHHTLWRHDNETLNFLQALADTGQQGYQEYLIVLAENGMAEETISRMRNFDDRVDDYVDDDFYDTFAVYG